MTNQKLSEQSTEELLKTKKTIKLVTGILLGMLIFLFILALYITFTKGFTALLIIPLGLSPIVIVNFNTIKNINKEIDSRKKS